MLSSLVNVFLHFDIHSAHFICNKSLKDSVIPKGWVDGIVLVSI